MLVLQVAVLTGLGGSGSVVQFESTQGLVVIAGGGGGASQVGNGGDGGQPNASPGDGPTDRNGDAGGGGGAGVSEPAGNASGGAGGDGINTDRCVRVFERWLIWQRRWWRRSLRASSRFLCHTLTNDQGGSGSLYDGGGGGGSRQLAIPTRSG